MGLEALVRWQPAGHLLHMPGEFIELAEDTGEILSIGRWVVVEACRRIRTWQDRFGRPDLRLYVNLSSRQFRDPGLVALIAGALRANGLAPSTLTLEITETALLVQSPETLERVAELRALGVRLSIDDFGTGFSSLGYLRSFDVDELKIDRAFVSDPGRTDAQVLSRAIVELGRGLSLELVAEGIETREQAAFFHLIGCRYGQGYLYAHPMPPSEVDRYFRRQHGTVVAAEGLAPHGNASGSITSLAGAKQKSA